MAAKKAEETRLLADVSSVGGVGSGVAEEDPCLYLKAVGTARRRLNHVIWEQRGVSFDHVAWKAGKQDVAAVGSSLSWPCGLKGCRRTPTGPP